MMMKTIRVAALVLAAALAGCNGDPAGPRGMSAVGRYSLQTVDGASLPALWMDQGPTYKVEVAAGEIVIQSDSSYTYTTDVRETNGATVTTNRYQEAGAVVQRADTVVFTAMTPLTGTFRGIVSGNQLTIGDLESSWVYRKQ
jgi:hypothetical protein